VDSRPLMRQAVGKSARHSVGPDDEDWPDHERRAGMRAAQNDPLEDRIQQDSHQQEVQYRFEAALHQLPALVPMKDQGVQIRRPSCPDIGEAPKNTEDDRDQRLQDESESAWPRQALGNIVEERLREDVEASSIEDVAQ